MEDKMLKQSIDRLDVSDKILNTLKKNNIKTLGQLCKKEKLELRKIELEDFEIKNVDIQLQLLGLCLKGSL